MILITSAKYVNPELQVEFGQIPPAFLPLGAERLYVHQHRLFEQRDEKIVLSLPQSFEVSSSDKVKLAKLGIETIFIKDGLSLGESIVNVLNMLLPLDEHLSILHGDTLFRELGHERIQDSIEISKVDTSYNWEFLVQNDNVTIDNTSYTKDELREYVLSGYFNFQNAYAFIRCLTINDFLFIKAIRQYAKENKTTLIKNDSWMDFGLSATYFHSRQSFTTERTFNSLKIADGYVTKCSEKKGKLQSEINWYEKMPEELALYLPRFDVVEDGLCYKTEYLYLNTLSELYVFGNLPVHAWKQIFYSLKDFLTKLHMHKNTDAHTNFDYKMKTLSRMEAFAKENQLDLQREWKLNGTVLPSIAGIIEDLDTYMTDAQSDTFIHGDFCMSNIMYDFKSNRIKVYDPRGMDFDDNVSCYGKGEYDYAKLMHSVIGLYDFIISGFYNLEHTEYALEFHIDNHDKLKLIQEQFEEVFALEDFKNIYAIMIHLFLSMLPLHSDNKQRQFALLANAFRLYQELERMK